MQIIEITPKAVPFCECSDCVTRYKKCYYRPSTTVPTLAQGDFCRFCGFYVVWHPNLVPYCNCAEVNAVHAGKELKYAKSTGELRGKLKAMGGKSRPTRVKDKHTNTCAFCGSDVVWKPKRRAKK